MVITSWERSKLENGKSISDAMDAVADTRALVIDVRANGGGDERLAQELAGCFVAERALYAKHVYRDPKSPGGFTPPRERWLEPNPNRPRYTGRVAVLSGPAVMSSCEGFLKMMKQVPGAVVVGAASQGSSGNPKPHDLHNGVTVFLPSWKDMLPDGREIEGVGIPPDVEVKAAPAEFAAADPVLESAPGATCANRQPTERARRPEPHPAATAIQRRSTSRANSSCSSSLIEAGAAAGGAIESAFDVGAYVTVRPFRPIHHSLLFFSHVSLANLQAVVILIPRILSPFPDRFGGLVGLQDNRGMSRVLELRR